MISRVINKYQKRLLVLTCLLVLILILIFYIHERNVGEKPRLSKLLNEKIFFFKKTSFQKFSPEQIKKIGNTMFERRQYTIEQCQNIKSKDKKINSREFLINRQYHLIWCNVFKAASTTWFYNFNILANYSVRYLQETASVPLHLARKRYPRPSPDELLKTKNDSISFIIVRHPFERLASAYISKLVYYSPKDIQYELMGQMIVEHFRKNDTVVPDGFPEDAPLFEEFVSYLLKVYNNGRELDIHWTPYSTFCTPCQYDFNFILKLETFAEDQQFLIEKANLYDVIEPVQLNYDVNDHNLDMFKIYERLTPYQLEGLYEIYEFDFRLFNYSVDSYRDLVKNNDDVYDFEVELNDPRIYPKFELINHSWVTEEGYSK